MPQIIVTLLNNKRTRQVVEDLDVTVGTAPGGYVVVAGENMSTEIQVNYPEDYASLVCYVHMRNSKGEYATVNFSGTSQTKSFTLPDTMTFAGNTVLTFYALNADTEVKTVWLPVIIPVSATGVDYHEVARCSEDVLEDAIARVANIESAEATRVANEITRQSNESSRTNAENIRRANESARVDSWTTLQPQLIQIIEDAADAHAAYEAILAIYNEFSMTLCYDDEGYVCTVDNEE